MEDVNLDGAKVWTEAKAKSEAARLNALVEDNPFLSYEVMATEGGCTVVLRSGALAHPEDAPADANQPGSE